MKLMMILFLVIQFSFQIHISITAILDILYTETLLKLFSVHLTYAET